ncbi:MAG: rhomboid family intramembrane serine protease [Nocardioides sp.]
MDRTTYGGLRRENPALTSIVLIGTNVFVWLAIVASGGASSRLTDLFAIKLGGFCSLNTRLPEDACRALDLNWSDGVDSGAFWQVLTSVFTHVDALHIAFNMFALYLLGPQLEALIGRARFLTLYLLSGLGGSAAVLWLSSYFASTVGASGAIFGLMAALLVVVHKRGGNPQPILLWILINVMITFTGRGISWQGHLGGFLAGLALATVVAYAPRQHRTRLQVAGMTGIGVLLVLIIAARVLTFPTVVS